MIREKYRISLAKGPAKGYGPFSTVQLEFNGPDHKMREREKQRGAATGEEEGGGGAPWPAGLSSPETAATELRGSVFKPKAPGERGSGGESE